MSPLLEKETELDGYVNYKFVRDGNNVAYEGSWNKHSVIAKQNNLGEPTGRKWASMRVDDAGLIVTMFNGGFRIRGKSTTCELRDDAEEARKQTGMIVHQITGKSVDTAS